jgi:hypothetical protein
LKNVLIFEKKGVLMILKTTHHLGAKAQYRMKPLGPSCRKKLLGCLLLCWAAVLGSWLLGSAGRTTG